MLQSYIIKKKTIKWREAKKIFFFKDKFLQEEKLSHLKESTIYEEALSYFSASK